MKYSSLFLNSLHYLGQCVGCHRSCEITASFCKHCLQELRKTLHSRQQIPFFVGLIPHFTAGLYQGALKNYLIDMKRSQFPTHTALSFLEDILSYWAPELELLEANSIVAVPRSPLHSVGEFNVPRFMALYLSKTLKIPILTPAPHKNLWNDFIYGPQKLKNLAERLQHPPKFSIASDMKPANSRFLILDDLSSSGTSLNTLIQGLENRKHRCAGIFTLLRNPLNTRSKPQNTMPKEET